MPDGPETPKMISGRFPQAIKNVFKHDFDLVFSFWLFDRGSGLDEVFRSMASQVSEAEIDVYGHKLQAALDMTKVGGWNVHTGNMMHKALSRIDNKLDISWFGSSFHGSDSVWVWIILLNLV